MEIIMREIKFRAFHKDKMKQVLGLSLNHDDVRFQNFIYGYYKGNLKDCELMQFTGLTDKNGKEIYEGDIIKGQDGNHDFVTYKENRFILEPLGDDCIYWDKSEVIGNIYENPELLEVNDDQ